MKKWYVITGILALLCIITLGTCSGQSSRVHELRDKLSDAQSELTAKANELSDVQSELGSVKSRLVQLKATKVINFGNGLLVSDIEKGYYEAQGKVKNVSDKPMRKVVVVVAFYNKDGQLDPDWGSVDSAAVYDLFPGETAEWKVHFGNWTDQDKGFFDVYTIGSYRGE